MTHAAEDQLLEQGIAIVGMSGRFPGARNIDEFWQALVAGREGLTRFTDELLDKAGVPEDVRTAPDYVPVAGALDDPAMFDAEFFGMTRTEAELTDPQHRLLLECAWEALEVAGYPPGRHQGRVGVFVSAANSGYRWQRLVDRPDRDDSPLQINVGNDVDMAALRLSYALNLVGPSVTVQTACSSSLVAVHLASQSLLLRESDLALAGGAAVRILEPAGYRYEEGGIASRDGRCRPFDAAADGTVSGDGVGVVLLKRLADALADGDHVYAVIRGSAVNNDGSDKAGITAPSPSGQAAVIAEALAVAGVDPGTVRYVEAHGTATPLGDPIEVRALTEAYGAGLPPGSCYLGSVKSNVGHLDVAAGVTGLIKAALAIERRFIPPTLHFTAPNPQLDLAHTPFQVNAVGVPWPEEDHPRRAAVSSFGIGGTNAHVLLEAAPQATPTAEVEQGQERQEEQHGQQGQDAPPEQTWQVLPLSARGPEALAEAASALAEHLRRTDVPLGDVAYTLQSGRAEFDHRRAVVCRDRDEAAALLARADRAEAQPVDTPSVVLMFPGQGSQYPGMGAELYQAEPVFRAALDECAGHLAPHLGWDVREVAFDRDATAAQRLGRTEYTQPTVFALDYALAKLVQSWGITPTAMIGHSLGEIVAAVLAGVFELADAARFVAHRARLMAELPSGRMLAVPLEESVLRTLLDPQGATIAAVNAPHSCVVAGTAEEVAAVRQRLTDQGHVVRELDTSHAFHTRLVEPALPALREVLRSMPLRPPRTRFVSNVTGTWITAEQATDPEYWVRHTRQPVRFADGIGTLLDLGRTVFVEVGPGEALSALVRIRHLPDGGRPSVAPLLRRRPRGPQDEVRSVLEGVAHLWQQGGTVDWAALRHGRRHRRVPLPTYPFQRQHYLVERPAPRLGAARRERARWTYLPVWHPSPARRAAAEPEPTTWLVFADATGLAEQAVARLRAAGHTVTTVTPGSGFRRRDTEAYEIRPGSIEEIGQLVRELAEAGRAPRRVVHAWGVVGDDAPGYRRAQDAGFFTLLGLAQALADDEPVRLDVLTDELYDVRGEPVRHPERATVVGAGLVLGQEHPRLAVRHVDVALPTEEPARQLLVGQLLAEWADDGPDRLVAYRDGRRWCRAFAPVELPAVDPPWRPDSGYLVTGADGEAALIFAERMVAAGARVALVGAGEPTPGAARLVAADPQRVSYLTADPSDADRLAEAVAAARSRLGRIDGVVHAVDVRGTGLAALKTPEQAEAVLAARVRSTLLLDDLLGHEQLEFFVVSSSTTGIVGGFGQAENAAAATFLDAFAHAAAARGRPAVTVNWSQWAWDDWYERQATVGQAREQFARHRREQGISAEDGMELAASIVTAALPQVVVSTIDFADVLADQENLTPAGFMASLAAGRSGDGRTGWDPAQEWPDDEVARDVAQIWRDVLGLDRLTREDDFFDVGGNSLFAIQIVARLRKRFGDLPMSVIFQAPTVDGVAAAIRAQQVEAIGLDEFEALLREVEAMSAEEAAMRLRSDGVE